jgi:hypothetical protein
METERECLLLLAKRFIMHKNWLFKQQSSGTIHALIKSELSLAIMKRIG